MKNEHIGVFIRQQRLAKSPKLTQRELAKLCGVATSAVTQWERGTSSPGVESIMRLEQIFNFDAKEFYGLKNNRSPLKLAEATRVYLPEYKQVPLISSQQAVQWSEEMGKIIKEPEAQWQKTTAEVGETAFALKMQGRSMQNPNGTPSIPDGAIIIIDPEAPVVDGSIVAIALEGSNEVMIRRQIKEGPHLYLESLNPDYKPIKVEEPYKLIGVVKQIIQNL